MRRLSVRRSGSANDLLFVVTGLGLGFLSGFLVRGLMGGVDRRRLRHFVAGLTGEYPAPPTPREAAGRIKEALSADESLQDLEFEVLPAGPGRVELHGWAPNRRARARAQRLAASAAPGTEVTNRFRVRGEDDLPGTEEPATGMEPARRQPA